jgi:hypothetical protein
LNPAQRSKVRNTSEGAAHPCVRLDSRWLFAIANAVATAAITLALFPSSVPAQEPCAVRKAAIDAKEPPARPTWKREHLEQELRFTRELVGRETVASLEEKLPPLRERAKQRQQVVKAETRLLQNLDADLAVAESEGLSREAIAALRKKRQDKYWEVRQAQDLLQSAIDQLDEANANWQRLAYIAALEEMLRRDEAWAAYDRTVKAFGEAETAMQTALDAARGTIAQEHQWYEEQRLGLENRSRERDRILNAREVRNRVVATFEQQKATLVKYECWPEVAEFIANTLEPAIFRLRQQRVALPSDADDEEEGLADLPELPGEIALGPDDEGGEDDGEGTDEDDWDAEDWEDGEMDDEEIVQIPSGDEGMDDGHGGQLFPPDSMEDQAEGEGGPTDAGGGQPGPGGDQVTPPAGASQGTAGGNWSMTCTHVEEGRRWTESGTFKLTILGTGQITGSYTTADSGEWPVTGQLGGGGTASGSGGTSLTSSFSWSGRLSQGTPGGRFTGSGDVSLRNMSPEGQTTCGGTWTATPN